MNLPPTTDSSTEVGTTTAAPEASDAPADEPTTAATEAGPRRLHRVWDRIGPAGWTLRSRLVALLVALLTGVSLTIGVISTLALQHYLVGQLDDKVDNAAARTLRFYQDLQHPPDQNNGFGFGPGTVEGTVIAKIQNGRLVGGAFVLTKTEETGTVAAGNTAALLSVPADTHEHTRDLGGDLGSYRLRAVPVGSATLLVVGLPMKSVSDATFRLAAIITLVTLVFVAIGAAIGAVVVRLTLRPLRRVASTAQQVSEMQLDRGEVALGVRVPDSYTDRRTEVGQVGAALNAMLVHVAEALSARQASETRVRRFVADASHELRTPLAAIRGYAELSRRSKEPIPADVAHALDRVESQTVRMTGLVEDLLLLASLDSGRPIVFEQVDLSVLLVGALSDAHAAGPDHRWRLDLPEDSVIVPGESARLTQVVVNLLANARTHTPAGTTVTAGLTTQGPNAVITVADDGPGIPRDLQPEVFERFSRGDSSRSRAAGSTGLGLSIVAAVVAAHHGTVRVSSVPGRTIFTVSLPLQRSEPAIQG